MLLREAPSRLCNDAATVGARFSDVSVPKRARLLQNASPCPLHETRRKIIHMAGADHRGDWIHKTSIVSSTLSGDVECWRWLSMEALAP